MALNLTPSLPPPPPFLSKYAIANYTGLVPQLVRRGWVGVLPFGLSANNRSGAAACCDPDCDAGEAPRRCPVPAIATLTLPGSMAARPGLALFHEP